MLDEIEVWCDKDYINKSRVLITKDANQTKVEFDVGRQFGSFKNYKGNMHSMLPLCVIQEG